MKSSLSQSNNTNAPLFATVKPRAAGHIIISAFLALAIIGGILYSYLYLRSRHIKQIPVAAKVNGSSVNIATVPQQAPQAQIAQDEAWTKNGQAIIGGTVHNVSSDKLANLAVEMEMKRRNDGQTETYTVEVTPKILLPAQQGKFSVHVPAHEFSGLRILHLKDATSAINIAFNIVPGAPRPLERAPQPKTIIVQKPASRTRDGEFLNTPDNPEVIH